MKIYVVTSGSRYYPGSGDSDWRRVCLTEAEANCYLEQNHNFDWASIIEIDTEKCTFNEISYR